MIVRAALGLLLLSLASAAAPTPAPGQAREQTYETSSNGTRRFESASGLSITMLVERANLGGREVEVGEIIFPVGSGSSGAGGHAHGAVEIFYVLEGALNHIVNGEATMLTAGMVGIVRPGDEVVHQVTSDIPVRALVIWAPGGEADRLASLFTEIPLSIRTGPHGQKGGAVWNAIPEAPDPDANFIFYLHGRIIETRGIRPTHPEFGIYEYQAILDTLASYGFHVISAARHADTRVGDYAETVKDQVFELIEAGVPAERISIVGFSKGGQIAATASALIERTDINFVLMAPCFPNLVQRNDLVLRGRILSIFDSSDTMAGSCQPLFDVAGELVVDREIVLDTGLMHGTFYRPIEEWLAPVIEWIAPPN
ncbi:MAG: cupin domain-containing protein [Gemmatimonadota bacterium]|nr:cupin domain-containing protein [Gemmatimonadota bacterium]